MVPNGKKIFISAASLFLTLFLISCIGESDDSVSTESETELQIALRGRVVNNAGMPLPDVEVVLSRFDMRDTTDSAGIYEIRGTKMGVAAADTLHFYLKEKLMKSESISNYKDTLPDQNISQPIADVDFSETPVEKWVVWDENSSAKTTLTKDNTFGHDDNNSLKLNTNSPDDVTIRVAVDDDISAVTSSEQITFWAHSMNPNNPTFQEYSPRIILRTSKGETCLYTPDDDILRNSIEKWAYYAIPLAGDGVWTKKSSANFSFTEVTTMEFIVNTWGYEPYTVWFDDIYYGKK